MNKEKASKILNISLNASESEIKSAYKKLAIKYHPDKNKDPSAEEKFKEISTAYNYLLNPEKENHQPNVNFNPFEHFNFNPFDAFNININHQHQNTPKKCGNVLHKINIKLCDAHTGLNKNFKIKVKKTCFECKETCNTCNGSGKIQTHRQIGPMTQVITNTCTPCRGSGKTHIKGSNINCSKCQNKQEWNEERTIELKIPKCVENGYMIEIENMGEQPINEKDIPGNLIFQIFVENKDDHFTRRVNDLIYNVNITLEESIVGKYIEVPYYDKIMFLDIKTFGIINPKKEYIIYNHGLGGKGNLILKYNIEYPEVTLTEQQIQSFKNIFNDIKK